MDEVIKTNSKNEEMVNGLGAVQSPIDLRDYKLEVNGKEVFPEEFELDMTACPVKNQGSVGSCVAHALSTVVEWHNYYQTEVKVKFSTGFIYGNRKNSTYKNSGMIVRDALGAVRKSGDVENNKFPYNVEVPQAISKFEEVYDELYKESYPNRISTYYSVNSVETIKKAIYEHGPVIFSVKWYNDIKLINGIMSHSSDEYSGRHCMVINGWDKNGWKIQNSWGTLWGKKGRATMPYDFKIEEAWGITDEIVEDIIEPYKNPFLEFFAKIFNFFINLFKSKD